MKIRWNVRSIRFRITPTELKALAEGLPVAEEIIFPGGTLWTVALEPSNSETALQSSCSAVTARISNLDIAHLAETDMEGLYYNAPGSDGISYSIEKDFPCAHPRASDGNEASAETFSPPAGFEQRKNCLIIGLPSDC